MKRYALKYNHPKATKALLITNTIGRKTQSPLDLFYLYFNFFYNSLIFSLQLYVNERAVCNLGVNATVPSFSTLITQFSANRNAFIGL